jgi:hypothetical protein
MAIAFEATCGECGRLHKFYCPDVNTIDHTVNYQGRCPETERQVDVTGATHVKVVYARPSGTIVVTKFDS